MKVNQINRDLSVIAALKGRRTALGLKARDNHPDQLVKVHKAQQGISR
jgi:hypothetical protein